MDCLLAYAACAVASLLCQGQGCLLCSWAAQSAAPTCSTLLTGTCLLPCSQTLHALQGTPSIESRLLVPCLLQQHNGTKSEICLALTLPLQSWLPLATSAQDHCSSLPAHVLACCTICRQHIAGAEHVQQACGAARFAHRHTKQGHVQACQQCGARHLRSNTERARVTCNDLQ